MDMSVNIRMDMIKQLLIALFFCIFTLNSVMAEDSNGRIVHNVVGEGACAIVGMSSEQCQLTALQRARVSAIEQASGIKVQANTIVTDGRLAADFIRTYSRGYLVNEKAEWLPLAQYQKDKASAPIPEYRVKIIADVHIPERRIKPIGLEAKINKVNFESGEQARITMKVGRNARIAIFNITADDKVVMVFPNLYEKDNEISGKESMVFPNAKSDTELIMETLQGHQRDAEAFFVVAIDEAHGKDFADSFTPFEPMGFSAFFQRYSTVSSFSEDKILAYEVNAKDNRK